MKSVTYVCLFAFAATLVFAGAVLADADSSSAANDLGNGVSWNIEDEVLTISYSGTGSGVMPDYTRNDHPPWYDQAQSMGDSVRAIVIKDGITYIGNYDFYYCTQVETISIPGSVTVIGKGAFSELTIVKSLTLPEGVVEIRKDAFEGCTSLDTIILPDSLKIIGADGFSGNIKSITFGSGIESVDIMWSGNPCCLFNYYLKSSSTPLGNLYSDASPLAGKTFKFSNADDGYWNMIESSGDLGSKPGSDGITEEEIPVCSFAAVFIIGCLAMMVIFNRH